MVLAFVVDKNHNLIQVVVFIRDTCECGTIIRPLEFAGKRWRGLSLPAWRCQRERAAADTPPLVGQCYQATCQGADMGLHMGGGGGDMQDVPDKRRPRDQNSLGRGADGAMHELCLQISDIQMFPMKTLKPCLVVSNR